jgi:hypothetical protein
LSLVFYLWASIGFFEDVFPKCFDLTYFKHRSLAVSYSNSIQSKVLIDCNYDFTKTFENFGYIQDKEAQFHFFSFPRCNWKSKDKCRGVDFVIPKNWRTRFVALFFQTERSILSALMKLIWSTSPEMLRQLERCVHHILQTIPTHLNI